MAEHNSSVVFHPDCVAWLPSDAEGMIILFRASHFASIPFTFFNGLISFSVKVNGSERGAEREREGNRRELNLEWDKNCGHKHPLGIAARFSGFK